MALLECADIIVVTDDESFEFLCRRSCKLIVAPHLSQSTNYKAMDYNGLYSQIKSRKLMNFKFVFDMTYGRSRPDFP